MQSYVEDSSLLKQIKLNKYQLGIKNTQRMNLALNIRSYDVISPMHCLNSQKIIEDL